MKIDLDVYDINLNRIAVLQNYYSMYWEEGYNTLGAFTIELLPSKELKTILLPDIYIARRDRQTCMIVKTVTVTTDRITLTGFPATRILKDRYFGGTISNVDAEPAILEIVDNIPNWPLLTHDLPTGLTDVFNSQVSRKNAFDVAQTIAVECDMGFTIKLDRQNKRLLLVCYKPEYSGNYKFSTAFGNLGGYEFEESSENYKNVAIVLGQGLSDERIIVTTGNIESVGANRREIVVDARGEKQESDENLDQYKSRLIAVGTKKLAEQTVIKNISFTPSGEDFGGKYDLGDILKFFIPDFGVTVSARIIAFSQKFQSNTQKTEIKIGAPIINWR